MEVEPGTNNEIDSTEDIPLCSSEFSEHADETLTTSANSLSIISNGNVHALADDNIDDLDSEQQADHEPNSTQNTFGKISTVML